MEIRERRSGVDGGRKFGEGERGRWMKGEKVEVDRKLPLNLLTLERGTDLTYERREGGVAVEGVGVFRSTASYLAMHVA